MTPETFVTAVSDPLQIIGALHYFGPEAKAAADALGIDGFRFYFAGRGGVLGPVSSAVFQSAFGYFDPALVDKMWSTSKERCDVNEAGASQLAVAYAIGEAGLGEVTGLAEAAESLDQLARSVDVAAMPLFAAFLDQPVPQSPAAAFMHQAILHRELRGSVHLAAVTATGVRSRAAHQIKRPNDLEMFGYHEQIEVDDGERERFAQAEPLTESAMVVQATTGLSSEQRSQVAETVQAAHAALTNT